MHGYGITFHVERVSKDILRLEEGSLYPALHRMMQSGWLRSEWGASENNRRARYYSLTPAGRRQLADEERNWGQTDGGRGPRMAVRVKGVSNVLEQPFQELAP